jgi:predicted P-loop ATPase/GTPase
MANKIVFCIVDDIDSYANDEIKSTIKNIADYTVSNILYKHYEVIVDKSEDQILQRAKDYDYAVVMSPGTEYINGFAFFDELEELVQQDFFVAGHVLDRTMHDAYYELHHQCYVVNMDSYKRLQCPTVGVFEKDASHTQIEPSRSVSNIHDDYTPIYVEPGTQSRTYSNKCHGWNLLRLAFENNLPVIVFDDNIRNNKKHYYPESKKDFYKHKEYIDYKFNYCKEHFVHTDNTEWQSDVNEKYEQLILPASGTLYLDLIDSGRVVFYDYNLKALDYWMENVTRKENIEYVFVHTNLLEELTILDHVNPTLKTLANFSNIFSYEGTVARYSLPQRLAAQNKLVESIKSKIKDLKINFTQEIKPELFNRLTWYL